MENRVTAKFVFGTGTRQGELRNTVPDEGQRPFAGFRPDLAVGFGVQITEEKRDARRPVEEAPFASTDSRLAVPDPERQVPIAVDHDLGVGGAKEREGESFRELENHLAVVLEERELVDFFVGLQVDSGDHLAGTDLHDHLLRRIVLRRSRLTGAVVVVLGKIR